MNDDFKERPVYSYIPKNLNSTGGLFGSSLEARRLLEGVIGIAIAVYLYKGISIFYQGEIALYICLIIGAALFIASLIGGGGEPLSIFLFNFINYENRRIFVTMRPPMPDFGDKKKVKSGEEEGRFSRSKILRRLKMLNPGKVNHPPLAEAGDLYSKETTDEENNI